MLPYVAATRARDLLVVPAIGGEPRQLIELEAGVTGLDWSPDGTTLVYAARGEREEPRRLWRLELATLESQALTTPPTGFVGESRPRFSPDGSWITKNTSTEITPRVMKKGSKWPENRSQTAIRIAARLR